MEYESSKLIIEGIIICILYLATMPLLIMFRKEAWIQEYPLSVREKYLEHRQESLDCTKKKYKYFLRLFIKKAIALGIYIAVMLVIAQTVEYKDIFLTESFLCCLIIWPAVTLLEALLLDIVFIGHCKKIRLPGTETLHKEYKSIYKKALKDILLGLLFGVVVFLSLFLIAMAALKIEIHKAEQKLEALQMELEEIQKDSLSQDSSELSAWNNKQWESKTDKLQSSSDELNEIANEFSEIVENIQHVVEYKEESKEAEQLNDGREIIRERPVFEGESLWSIAQQVYGNPYKWQDIFEANRTLLGNNPALLYTNQFLTLPDTGKSDYTGYEYCYEDIVTGTGDWEGLTEYISPDCGYKVQNCIFYYNTPESNGECFRICYPKLISLNGKDVTIINEEIRKRALINADYFLINRNEEFAQRLDNDENYSEKWTQDQVNYIITYLDQDTISVVFQHYLFEGNIYAEYLELNSYTADINTGINYKSTELLTNLEDGKIAEKINTEILAFYQKNNSEFQTWAFTEVITPELINETLQTAQVVEGRYYCNTFITPDGVGVGITYRMNKKIGEYSKILRGWKTVTIPTEEIKEYLTTAPVLKNLK